VIGDAHAGCGERRHALHRMIAPGLTCQMSRQ
jgi:hypothetical protein